MSFPFAYQAERELNFAHQQLQNYTLSLLCVYILAALAFTQGFCRDSNAQQALESIEIERTRLQRVCERRMVLETGKKELPFITCYRYNQNVTTTIMNI